MFRFTTDTIAPHERIDFLADFLSRTLAPFRLEPAEELVFRNEVSVRMVGAMPLIRVDGAGYRGSRKSFEIARTNDHFYAVALHLGGATRLTVRGEEKRLESGDLVVLDTMHDVDFGFELPYQHLLVKLPKDKFEARLRRPECLHGSVLSRDHPLARLFSGYLAAGFATGDGQPRVVADMFEQHLLDLLSVAFAARDSEPEKYSNALGAARLARIKSDLAANPTLSLAAIAAMQGVTPRYIQMLFESEQITFTAFALDLRLVRARSMLADRRYDAWTVAAVAYEAGFGDLSHFHRQFKRRYGASPSDVRRGRDGRWPRLESFVLACLGLSAAATEMAVLL